MHNEKSMHFQENVYFHSNSQQINNRSMTSIEGAAATFEKLSVSIAFCNQIARKEMNDSHFRF